MVRFALQTALCFGFASAVMAMPGDDLKFVNLPKFNSRTHATWGPILTDVVQHEAPGDQNNYSDKVTLAHETTHGINSYIRNKMNNTGRRANGFYVLQNQAVIIEEPNMRKSQVAPFVPPSLRGSRYDLYVVGSTSWDDRPLYIFDEWSAYTNGSAAGVDLVQNNLWTYGSRDAVAGALDFSIYAIATAMAVERFDPQYFVQHKQFTEFLGYNLRRAMTVFYRGQTIPDFARTAQDTMLSQLRTSPDANDLRVFSRRIFGNEFCQQVLGF